MSYLTSSTTFKSIGQAGQVARTSPQSQNASAAEKARHAQQKLTFALVDSGMGGGMTAARLRGEVRQLGSYFCLPIGDKTPAIATGYTAAMALWPLVAPLADVDGNNDGRVAENVIIACNSASVRREDALQLMTSYCAAVAQDHDNKMGLDPTIKANFLALHAKVQQDPKYFDKHVKEIVTETARAGVDDVTQRLAIHPSAYVRIDSTNGTADSQAYPARFCEQLKSHADNGFITRETFKSKVKQGGADYVVNHDVLTFSLKGKKKVVVIESRGNPPWVPAIEGNSDDKVKKELVGQSMRASEAALAGVRHDQRFRAFYEKLDAEHQVGLNAALETGGRGANTHMLCCTHYPAMRTVLAEQFNPSNDNVASGKAPLSFIDQASVVEHIAKTLDPGASAPERGPLNLVLTVGSQNYGGSAGYLKTSIPNGHATAQTLKTVLEATHEASRSNVPTSQAIASVKVFQQGEPTQLIKSQDSGGPHQGLLQQQFETIHRSIAGPFTDRILDEQGLKRNTNPARGYDAPQYALTDVAKAKIIKPNYDPAVDSQTRKINAMTQARFDRIGELMTLGENRGIDIIGLYNDQGAQLTNGVARILQIKETNEADKSEPQRVGILTGFTVVDNATKSRKGGENDGPPGAALMARTLIQQGVPVTMVVDESSEASLASALIGCDLAELTPAAAQAVRDKTLSHADLTTKHLAPKAPATVELLQFEIPAFNNKTPDPSLTREQAEQDKQAATEQSTVNLRNARVTTMISIERPSVTADGRMTSMLGVDISPFNLDMSPVLSAPANAHSPYTIGIGDGGNEFGTGGISAQVRNLRTPALELVVKNGDHIAASPAHATDVMLLSTVSNHGGMVFAMALDAATTQGDDDALSKKLDGTIAAYNNTISYLYANGMSLDGVDKQNQLSVDGRTLGSQEQAAQRFVALQGRVPLGRGRRGDSDETTHNDVFLKFKHAMLSDPTKSSNFAEHRPIIQSKL